MCDLKYLKKILADVILSVTLFNGWTAEVFSTHLNTGHELLIVTIVILVYQNSFVFKN